MKRGAGVLLVCFAGALSACSEIHVPKVLPKPVQVGGGIVRIQDGDVTCWLSAAGAISCVRDYRKGN